MAFVNQKSTDSSPKHSVIMM